MNDLPALLLAWIVGGAIGMFFYGGLWWTVSKVSESRRPALFIVGSFLLRTCVALAGLYAVIAGGHWERLVAWLVGFLVARLIITRLTRSPVLSRGSRGEEPRHASESR